MEYEDLNGKEKQEVIDTFRASGKLNGVPLKAWLFLDGNWTVTFSTLYDLTAKLQYQTERADANWKALCACRNEEE